MFDPTVWGTVAAWTSALLTGLSVLAAVVYYIFDRRRERRAQAASVVVWLHPHEHGPPFIKMMNLSDKPIFDYGCIIEAKPKREIEKLDPRGQYAGPFEWPKNNELKYREGPQLHRLPRRQRALSRPRRNCRTSRPVGVQPHGLQVLRGLPRRIRKVLGDRR